MSRLLDELGDHRDPEITLGTGALLGIFVGIVLVCAIFFGLGYSLGRHSGGPSLASASNTKTTPKSAVAVVGSDPNSPAVPTDKASSTSIARVPTRAQPRTEPEPTTTQRSKGGPAKQGPSTNGTPNPSQTMVQLMAAAQSGDAEVLATALRKRGYHALVRAEPDHLYHVQIGPFSSRADADTMRRKLQADGYNAILK